MLTISHKCLRCGLTMQDINNEQAFCVDCRKQNHVNPSQWRTLIFPRTAPVCTFCKSRQAVAAEHSQQGLTGAFACQPCVKSFHLTLHAQ